MKVFKHWFFKGVCLPVLAVASSAGVAYASDIEDGIYRGKLEVQPGVSLVVGISIKDGVITHDSPNQGMFDKPVSSQSIDGKQLKYTDESLSIFYSGELDGNTIKGTFKQGRAFTLNLTKLDAKDKARMINEGRYSGDLVVNDDVTLPLNLNIAVLHQDYLATLDSPAQQSFGIPTENLVISPERLAFESKMISADFSGDMTEQGYQGTFNQGFARPLTLKKN